MPGRMTVDRLGGPTFEIGDGTGEHVATLNEAEAQELYAALGLALLVRGPVNIATGNAVVGSQIGSVGGNAYRDAFDTEWDNF